MKVKYVNESSDTDKKYLEMGKKYEVDEVIIHSWNTTVYLKKFKNVGFNSVCFDDEFQEDLDNAIHYFWDNEHEDWYRDIFFRDFY